MYFKKLEISGFKSFADRTVVTFDQGITAIVGPNGCGKSNILDALRWVLGEQSAKELRGAAMADVIFNGSEERQAMGMSEVTVTFDNADSRLPIDFSEVQVTRRLYRSGESEYLLNKAPCRLRDIQELFMDTGIGTNAYSMVGQGKMDMVLSSKPEDRRYLFEEAAGVIKYKTRKREALRKLQSAEQNLLRLGDIIAEVERQMRSLKRQVNAAIRYRELSERLRELEIRAIWLKYTRLVANVERVRKEFAEAGDAYEKVQAEIGTQEARFEELGLRRIELDRVLMARREGVHNLDSEMEKIERQVALLRQQIDFAKEQQARAVEEEAAFRERAAALAEQMGSTGGRRAGYEREIAELEQRLEAKAADHAAAQARLAEADAQLETVRAQDVARMNARAKSATELEAIDENLRNADQQLQALHARQHSENERRQDVSGALQTAQHEEAEKQAALNDAETRRATAVADHAVKTEEQRALNEQWQTVRERKSSLTARLHSLRELRDSYEGFAHGVKAVMQAKQRGQRGFEDVVGPVGDILSPEAKFERAIEAALGGAVNNIVVETADAAKRAIEFLKQNRAGRVTFLPLDTIRGGRCDDGGVGGERGVIGPAIGFVRFEPRMQSAVEYLLRDTVVVETIDDAIRIARTRQRYPRLVTLDGEMVSSAGAVTGGRTKHDSRGLLGRSAEIEELEKQVDALEVEAAQLAERGKALLETIDRLAKEARELESTENALRRELRDIGVQIARHSTELENLAKSAEALEAQRAALAERRDDLQRRRDETRARVDGMDSDDEAHQAELAAAQAQAQAAREALTAQASALSELRIEAASAKQRMEEAERDSVREQREHDAALDEAARRAALQEELTANQKALEDEVALNLERSAALSEDKEEARKKVVEAENERNVLLEETEQLDKSLRALREQGRELQSRVHKLEIELRHDEDQIAFFIERIQTEYNIALAALTKKDVGKDDLEDAERDKEVTQLRTALQRMGTVNLMAIEEYEALEKRYEFLSAQSADLNQARDALLDVIARTDEKMRDLFMRTFNLVAEHFREHFRRLFRGGQARIYLLDEDNPLESGIEIEVRPPGKKNQSISLLSGGESAMTAIALLFSIFKARPSPFCVFDEVDAPLDDANIGRFTTLLSEFAVGSQFVVITHNKQTMAKAQALYGVTQQERGVSQLVSVKFAEAAETAA